MKHRNRLLSTSTLCFSAMLFAATLAAGHASAFDPNEGAAPVPEVSSTSLPSTDALTKRERPASASFPRIIQQTRPPIQFAPLATPTVATAPKSVVNADAPLAVQPVSAPALPVVEATPTPSSIKKIHFPPVDPAVASKAQQQLSITPVTPVVPVAVAAPVEVTPTPSSIVATTPANAPSNFIAPLPLMPPVAAAPVMPAPVAAPILPSAIVPTPAPSLLPEPVVASPAAVPAPVETLSHDSKTILSRIPSKMDAPKPGKAAKLSLNRISPKVEPLEVKTGKVDAYEASGIKISVRRPGLDTNYELNRAFTALSGGDSATAIEIYKSILSTEPTNADALFGLAAIYHRQGQIDKARPLYKTLLENYPNHREGINNFLVLVSDESPQESLAELERLEQRNPDFSPIPAQEAVVLSKLGYGAQARDKMVRAIELAPDNLAYKYNLAVMLDGQGLYDQAAPLYRLLISAASRGEAIPATTDALQKRLNYISTASTSARTNTN